MAEMIVPGDVVKPKFTTIQDSRTHARRAFSSDELKVIEEKWKCLKEFVVMYSESVADSAYIRIEGLPGVWLSSDFTVSTHKTCATRERMDILNELMEKHDLQVARKEVVLKLAQKVSDAIEDVAFTELNDTLGAIEINVAVQYVLIAYFLKHAIGQHPGFTRPLEDVVHEGEMLYRPTKPNNDPMYG